MKFLCLANFPIFEGLFPKGRVVKKFRKKISELLRPWGTSGVMCRGQLKNALFCRALVINPHGAINF